MQIIPFLNGGYVIHRMPYANGKLSAWFDAEGRLLDIEKFDVNGRKTGNGIYKAMEHARRIGLRFTPPKTVYPYTELSPMDEMHEAGHSEKDFH